MLSKQVPGGLTSACRVVHRDARTTPGPALGSGGNTVVFSPLGLALPHLSNFTVRTMPRYPKFGAVHVMIGPGRVSRRRELGVDPSACLTYNSVSSQELIAESTPSGRSELWVQNRGPAVELGGSGKSCGGARLAVRVQSGMRH